ncbi:MAG: AAA family ATPase [Candidatus Aenigmatarchaeota archaeon]
MKTIICLVGMPGAGKGEVGKILQTKGISVTTMSSVPKAEVRKRGLEMNSKNLDAVAFSLRKEFGKDIVAKRVAGMLAGVKPDVVCVDGVRNIEEIDVLKKAGNVKIVAISAPVDMRFRRQIERKDDRDPKNMEEFELRDVRSREFGMEKVIIIADYKITNNGTIKDLKTKVEKILTDIGHV